jgi:hypothetical protein
MDDIKKKYTISYLKAPFLKDYFLKYLVNEKVDTKSVSKMFMIMIKKDDKKDDDEDYDDENFYDTKDDLYSVYGFTKEEKILKDIKKL